MTTRDEIAADWAARGFDCALWTDPPGQRWENFTHATDELVLVLDGAMEFEIAGVVQHPRPGTELLIPAGAVHSARNIGSTTAHWLYGYREIRPAGSPQRANSDRAR
jgi:mannose-6-phosphate isomerase-like protein (cupin superfamily)